MLKILDPNKSYLEEIVNSIADPIFVKDSNHRWVFLNDAFCKFINHTREEMIGKTDYDFFSDEESRIFWEKDELVFNSTGENINEEQITDAGGLTHTIVTKKMMYMDAKGEKFVVGIIRDITDLKHREEILKERISELEKANAKLTEDLGGSKS